MPSGSIHVSQDDESRDRAPVWVVSFADMSLLLLGFFTMLLAIASQTKATDADMLRVLASVKVGFGYTPEESSSDELDLAVMRLLATRKRGPYKTDLEWTTPAIAGRTIRAKDQWVRLRGIVGEAIIFPHNSAVLPDSDDTEANLTAIAGVVRNHFRRIVIQGHCSLPEARRGPGGHWLAFQRAATIRRELIARGVDSDRIRIVSSASHDRYPETSSRIDRRVEVTLSAYYLPGKDFEF